MIVIDNTPSQANRPEAVQPVSSGVAGVQAPAFVEWPPARLRSTAQVKELTWPLRERLMEAAGERLIDDRNRALLAVAYDAVLRRAELAALQPTDLLIEMPGDATLLVRRSKTDTEGRGETVYIALDTVRLVRVWLECGGVTDGWLFRSVRKCGAIGSGSTRARCRASSRRLRAGRGCRRRWSRGCRDTAPGSAPPWT